MPDIADVLQRLDMPVVKSRYDSLGKLTPGGVLVIAEPLPGAKTEETMRTLLKADTMLLILPKWTGRPSSSKPGWIGEASRWIAAVAVLGAASGRAEGGPVGRRCGELDDTIRSTSHRTI